MELGTDFSERSADTEEYNCLDDCVYQLNGTERRYRNAEILTLILPKVGGGGLEAYFKFSSHFAFFLKLRITLVPNSQMPLYNMAFSNF